VRDAVALPADLRGRGRERLRGTRLAVSRWSNDPAGRRTSVKRMGEALRPDEHLRLGAATGRPEVREDLEGRVVLEDLASGDGHLVDLVGPVGDAQRADRG